MNDIKSSADLDQRAALFNIITDSWYTLLAVYDEMELLIGDDCFRIVIKDEFIKNRDVKEKSNLIEYEMDIIYNSAEVGTFRGKAGMSGFELSVLEKFSIQASNIRKQYKSSLLIPYGLAVTDKSKNVWTNAIADEIISRTGLEENYSEYVNDEQLFEKAAVFVKDFERNGFELTVISIPVLSQNKIAGYFVILAESSWKYKENTYNTVVIKEIHHRVKNNLQTIASLLRLQLRRSKSKVVKKALQESINKISSIALIHEELSKGGIEQINIKATIASIMEMILGTLVPHDKDIKGELEGSDVYADANLTSMLSLCLTELLQNSVEHAFQFRKKGTIRVKVEESNGYVTVVVEDDGVGFTRKKDKNSLGLEIIEMITRESLKGEFTIEGHLYGCKSTVRFPLHTVSGRKL